MERPIFLLRTALLLACAWPHTHASAQRVDEAAGASTTELDAIHVFGRARPLSRFPGAVGVLDGEALRDGQRRVSLSESLVRVPGISVQDRGNYAQDLQVQSRGFGARSTFGIRGLHLVADGIPASAPDGQGQAATFALDLLDRIEVLRGPLALQYGNASGGAIVGASELEADGDRFAIDAWRGSADSARAALRGDGSAGDGAWRGRIAAGMFRTDGARPHSAARRRQFDAVGEWRPRDGDLMRAVFGDLSQTLSQDPLGLTRDALRATPRGTDPAALRFDTRKRVDNRQAGLRWERERPGGSGSWIGAYSIDRGIEQYLPVPVAAQAAPGSAGGVIDLARTTTGLDLGHRWAWRRGALSLGLQASRLDEARRGYENFTGDALAPRLGVRGRLRRDERNRIDVREAFVVGEVAPAADWALLGGLRHARSEVASDDRYIAPGNGDDSGRLRYRETAASAGVARAFAWGEAFAAIGRGFETPTIIELAYRPDGEPGFNDALAPAHARSAEAGVRLRRDGFEASVAAYRIEGRDDIVPAESSGGRASFANAGRTRRQGLEAGASGSLGARWSYALAANWIDARFTDDFSYRVGAATRTVEAGNRIPGIARADGYAEARWRSAGGAFRTALEARASTGMPVDDRNTDAASGHVSFALRAAWRPLALHGWHAFARIDNLFDRRFVGSVIVNEANGRYFEPGAGRGFTLGIGFDFGPG